MTSKYLLLVVSFFAISANAQMAMEQKPETKFNVQLQSLQFNGDIRYRYDHEDYEGQAVETQDVQKLRVRVGFLAQLVDSVKFDFRLASGSGRTSTNQTLGSNSSASPAVAIDKAAFGLGVAENLTATLGRMNNSLVLAGSNDLTWDSDLNFDGVSLKWNPALAADSMDTTFSLSRFVIASETTNARAVDLDIAQMAIKTKNMGDKYILGTLGYYNYEQLKGHTFLGATGINNNGGTTTYEDEYRILDIGLEYGFNVGPQVIAVYGDYTQNTTVTDDNVAYILGVKLNKLKKKHDWAATYDYRRVEKRSVVDAFTDGESFGGGVNGESHRLTFGYQVGDSWYTQLSGFVGKTQIASGENSLDRTRILVDVGASF